jgi:hypothetical protein
MKNRERRLISLERVSVVHFNPDKGYISYLEEGADGKFNFKGIMLSAEILNNDY